jgi:hypothetical protein
LTAVLQVHPGAVITPGGTSWQASRANNTDTGRLYHKLLRRGRTFQGRPMRFEYRDRGDCHLQVRPGDGGITDKAGVEHRLRLTAERAREMLSALLLVLPPRH